MGMALTAASAVMGAVSSYKQAENQRSALEYQASVQRNNATIAGYEASGAINNGQTNEENQHLKTGQIFGAQRAAMAANGIDLGTGNATETLATTQLMGARDAAQIHDNAMRQAWGYSTQQRNALDNAAAYTSQRNSINPLLAASTSLLTGATNVATNWDKLAKANGTPNASAQVAAYWKS